MFLTFILTALISLSWSLQSNSKFSFLSYKFSFFSFVFSLLWTDEPPIVNIRRLDAMHLLRNITHSSYCPSALWLYCLIYRDRKRGIIAYVRFDVILSKSGLFQDYRPPCFLGASSITCSLQLKATPSSYVRL